MSGDASHKITAPNGGSARAQDGLGRPHSVRPGFATCRSLPNICLCWPHGLCGCLRPDHPVSGRWHRACGQL